LYDKCVIYFITCFSKMFGEGMGNRLSQYLCINVMVAEQFVVRRRIYAENATYKLTRHCI